MNRKDLNKLVKKTVSNTIKNITALSLQTFGCGTTTSETQTEENKGLRTSGAGG